MSPVSPVFHAIVTVSNVRYIHMNLFLPDWTVRPNPEGRIVRKPEGRIFDHKAEW